MKTPLALRNLVHERVRAGVAVAGVAFAVVLILMQLGFFFSVARTATLVYDRLNFDLAIVSSDYLHMGKAGMIPLERLYQAQDLPEVAGASPFWVSFNLWLNPDPRSHQRRSMMILAFRPDDAVVNLPEVEKYRNDLKELRTVLVDRLSRPEFGPHGPGVSTDIGQTAVRVIGEYTMGTGFSADGAVMTSDRTLFMITPMLPRNRATLGLISLRPGTNARRVKERLEQLLPQDSQVMTHDELNRYEQHHWVVKTSVGVIFGLGVGVALVVGLAIVYQVLSSDIANRMPEYATLMAMGYGRRYISGVVLQQAVLMALAGFVPGWLVSYVLFKVAAAGANLPMAMTPALTLAVLALNLTMCVTSGLLSLRKVNTADPADLFT
ncbi:MAG TPA: ABC transporter permease DevC [Pirellulales bacterium]|jgi:putative ABC transport system permease protein|nr:ABC transporter permease DevC [Pirellulales bacterium]